MADWAIGEHQTLPIKVDERLSDPQRPIIIVIIMLHLLNLEASEQLTIKINSLLGMGITLEHDKSGNLAHGMLSSRR
jgi:hypothetical protein